MTINELTQERVKECLEYDSNTGIFYRLFADGSKKETGWPIKGGYLQTSLDNRFLLLHRLAWFYVHGVWPKNQIDHINGVRDDNRLVNLREATALENQQNMRKHKDNTSGFLGITYQASRKKWAAKIQVNRKPKFLGRFDTPEEAHEAYKKAKAQLHSFNPEVTT